MRGGALPLLCWVLALAVMGTVNAIWTGDTIQIGTYTAAVVSIAVLAGLLVLSAPEARQRGEPTAPNKPEAVTRSSVAVVVMALGLGTLLFGFVFGHFPIYFGAGMILAGLGRLLLELRAQREALRSTIRSEDPAGGA